MNTTNGRLQRPAGRVLGKPIPQRVPTVPRPHFPASPSESSISIASQSSFNVEASNGIHNGTTNGNGYRGQPAGVETPDRMICPICEEDMVTLLQLNRHLDDNHQEVEEVEKDDIQSWFKKRMQKAKQFQPVALINSKLKGLEVFEANETPVQITQTAAPERAAQQQPIIRDREPDELVTRAHWQKTTGRDLCTDPGCQRLLGINNGSINCRKCGKLFCDEHTLYQIKLSRSAQHEPVRGIWCRVCETCYMSREGYLDHKGFVRDHTDTFFKHRRKNVDRQHLEITRLEKRLTKLTQLLTTEPPKSSLWPGSLQSQRKVLEQSVVTWEDDAKVVNCPFCKQTFTNFGLRKHHCRLCGRVVCGDLRTSCSSEVGLNVSSTSADTSLDVRICKECHQTVFSKKDFDDELAARPPDLRSYETMIQFEKGILAMLPRFQKLLITLQDPDKPPSPQQLMEATKTRKKLLDTFTQYDKVAKRIMSLPSSSSTQLQLQKAIYKQSVEFLHTHMLPLKTLPKILKHSTSPLPSSPRGNGRSLSQLSQINDNASQASSATEMDEEEKTLKETLAVLEEQKFLVGEMIEAAKKGRRFDEVGALVQSVKDLDTEIGKAEGQLREFERRSGM